MTICVRVWFHHLVPDNLKYRREVNAGYCPRELWMRPITNYFAVNFGSFGDLLRTRTELFIRSR